MRNIKPIDIGLILCGGRHCILFGIWFSRGDQPDAVSVRFRSYHYADRRLTNDMDLPTLAATTCQNGAYSVQTESEEIPYDRQINAFVRDDPRAKRLTQVRGIGPITASAIVATIGNGRDFRNGRQFAPGSA